MKTVSLEEDQAVLLQTIDETGGQDVDNLAETLRFDRPQLVNLLVNLQHKGLIKLRVTAYGTDAELSSKGRKTIGLIWPDLPFIRYS